MSNLKNNKKKNKISFKEIIIDLLPKQTNSKDINVKNRVSTFKQRNFFIIILLLLITIIVRIFYLQFIESNFLKKMAYSQQSSSETLAATRGNIYDCNGNLLAITYESDTISVTPSDISSDYKNLISLKLSELFELDYTEVYNKVTSTSKTETIIKNVDQDKVTELTNWMTENKINKGITITQKSTRYYPNNNLASSLIGCVGTDNQGLSGIEYSWDSILTGTSGKIVTSKDASQSEIPNSEETYIAAQNGYNLNLTIDVEIQSIVEKYLEEAVIDNKCEGGSVIAMNPSTGNILAMADYPNYNLNTPFTPTDSTLLETWDTLTTSEKNNAIQEMWRNKCVSDTYEPGSVFKVITSAIALEEDITETDVANDFTCKGYESVADRIIKCWKTDGSHGSQTLRKALMNSCNPSFMKLGKRIGATTFFKYFQAFGFTEKTGVSLSGEAIGKYHNEESLENPVNLAVASFGQRFTITPLQMITAISSIANDGILVQPKIVDSITNTDTGEVTKFDTTEVRQVISSQTASEVKSIMQSVATEGTGRKANIAGYSIGGKTGTSEPIDGSGDGYVSSYVAISPVEDTKIVLLVILYSPDPNNHNAGTIVAPVVKKMLSEILPYMGIAYDSTAKEITDNSSNNEQLY